MGGLVIETIRPGVQFTPEAAAAFRRAEAQVRAEFGRDIDVNSTYRDRDTQLAMYNAWQAWVTGRGPRPNHSKALHPDDPLAFHTKGTALDSDDWRNARIEAILAEHGFIRNRLYVPNEQHHFEYLPERNQHRNNPAPAATPKTHVHEEDEMLFLNLRMKAGTHKIAVGTGVLRHFIREDPYEKIKNLGRVDDAWQNVELHEFKPLLWTYGIDLDAYRIEGSKMLVLDPLTGEYREGGMWSAENVIRAQQQEILALLKRK